MENVFFTVICPIYNSQKFLKHIFKSLEDQLFKNFEIIFIDDCSIDASLKEIEKLSYNSDLNIKIAQNKINLGAGASRNEGLKAAKGKWIAFLDSDDFWTEDKLEKCKKVIEMNPEINLISHDEYKLKNGIVIGELNYSKKNKKYPFTPRRLYWSNYFSTSATVLKRSEVQNNLFEPSLRSCQDYEFWLRLSSKLKPYFLSDKLGYYRVHQNNITSGPILRRWKNELRVAYLYKPAMGCSLYIMKCMRIHASYSVSKLKSFLN